MTSEVAICNLALAGLGDSATVASIDPPEGSAQAEHCATFYPQARDLLMEMHNWKFITRRATLAELAVDAFNWAYAYAEPANAIKIVKVITAADLSTAKTQPFETECDVSGASLIRTDLPEAVAIYTVRVTDTTKFSPLFVECLIWLLRSYLAGPVLKGDAGRAESKACLSMFRAIFAQATVSDTNQRHLEQEHTPGWIGGR